MQTYEEDVFFMFLFLRPLSQSALPRPRGGCLCLSLASISICLCLASISICLASWLPRPWSPHSAFSLPWLTLGSSALAPASKICVDYITDSAVRHQMMFCIPVLSHTHTHTCLTAHFPRLPGWAGTRKVKPIWILLKQETVSGSGITWAICKYAPCSRQTTMPAPHHSVLYRPDALPAAQPRA